MVLFDTVKTKNEKWRTHNLQVKNIVFEMKLSIYLIELVIELFIISNLCKYVEKVQIMLLTAKQAHSRWDQISAQASKQMNEANEQMSNSKLNHRLMVQ